MHLKYFTCLFLFFFLLVKLSYSQKADSVLFLAELIDEGIKNNPQLKAYRSTWQSAQARVPQAGALPDPMFNLNLLNLPADHLVFNQEAMTGKQLGLKQTVPFPGKLDLKEKIARSGVLISQSAFKELKNRLIKNISQTYFDLFYVDQSIATTQKNQALLAEFAKIAEKKYQVGKGLQQDVLKAQVAHSQMSERLIALTEQRKKIEIQLNMLLNRPAATKLGKPILPAFKRFPFQKDRLAGQVEKNRPLLKAWQFKLQQSREKIALAKRNYWPDFTLSLAYTQRSILQNGNGGVDFLSGGIGFNVPIYFWRKQSKRLEENQVNRRRVQENFVNVRNKVLAALETTLSVLRKDSRLIELYKDGIVPQASQALQSAMIGYQTDKADFLTLLNSQMTLFNFQLKYTRLLTEYNKNLAELAFITGNHQEI